MIRFTTASLFAASALAGAAHADVFASYGFDGSSLASDDASALTLASDVVLPVPVGSNATDAMHLTTDVGDPQPALRSFNNRASTTIAGSTDGTIDGQAFFTFTISPDGASSYELNAISFTARYSNSGDAGNAPTIHVQSDLTGAFTTIQSYNYANITSFTGQNEALGVDFEDLVDPITFRFVYTVSSSSSARNIVIDNVVVEGTAVPIPEPASLALAGLGALLALARGRRARS